METAASWPCATAQMMFFGPNAESPPKKTFGTLAWNVTLSRTGRPDLSNSMPRVALDPGEGVLLADRDQHVVALEELIGLAGGDQAAAALVVVDGLDLLEGHAAQFSGS